MPNMLGELIAGQSAASLDPPSPFPIFLLPCLATQSSYGHAPGSQTGTTNAALDPDHPAPLSLSSSSDLSSAATPTRAASPASSIGHRNPSADEGPFRRKDDVEDSHGNEEHVPAVIDKAGFLVRAQPDTLRCANCSADVAFATQIVSKGFTGRHGRAFLVAGPKADNTPSWPGFSVMPTGSVGSKEGGPGQGLINIRVGKPESRQLVTGQHVVADIICAVCGVKVGWKYVDAREPAQRYKIGKFILETARVVEFRCWESDGNKGHDWERPSFVGAATKRSIERRTGSLETERMARKHGPTNAEIVFNSEDEDECDDLFSGTWDAETVAKRRNGRCANGKFALLRRDS